MITGTEAEYQSDAGSTKTPHSSPGRVTSVVDICEKIDHISMALYCIWVSLQHFQTNSNRNATLHTSC